MDGILPRDSAMTVTVIRFCVSARFDRAQEQPPMTWKALLAAVTGGALAWLNWDSGSVLGDDNVFRTY